jgi:8-oxo-dGTP pyrophosphatase MutT (NUDIX family)
VAAVMLMAEDGSVLMMRRVDDNSWAFPAGGVKPGETLEQAGWREVFEETGFRLGDVGRRFMRRVKGGVDCVTFVTQVEKFTPTLNHEHDSWAWLDPKAVARSARDPDAPDPTRPHENADDAFERELAVPYGD